MGPGLREVMATLAAQGLTPAGPWFTHHRHRPSETFDFEVCVPVATEVSASGRVTPGRLPAARVARAVYRGPYEYASPDSDKDYFPQTEKVAGGVIASTGHH